MENLVFLKLGGSLITDKLRPHTPRLKTLKDLASQIASARIADPNLLLLLGHGSGSFGHVVAKKYKTREGLPPPFYKKRGGEQEGNYWRGFSEVWHEADALNQFVMSALREANIPAMAMPPSSSVVARDGQVATWNLDPIRSALSKGIVPVVYGDVVFDEVRGGTILSTEDLFMHLAREMRPQRILLAGIEDGVYADFPVRKQQVKRVTPGSFKKVRASIGSSAGTDVTGGMQSKVQQMVELVKSTSGLTIQIFSGLNSGNVQKALLGKELGTLIEPD
ncbi:MAG: isopentenyl phosphate kinase family protein [Anaerolineales bacterium]|uniref:Isopentenyl phosphate kinase n=1 Tax=Candidatus Desulfolinea nitratireducens TaxID=2841698 RepID=A0A8J6NHT4_9CHLR|nr:isopentenyl phosphate kinase family protein [Candidatus Desulfolinea nitratireducens]MBL6961834.1 isopentenyl phosphate kinase family protein [Anaerolineales bacterium]